MCRQCETRSMHLCNLFCLSLSFFFRIYLICIQLTVAHALHHLSNVCNFSWLSHSIKINWRVWSGLSQCMHAWSWNLRSCQLPFWFGCCNHWKKWHNHPLFFCNKTKKRNSQLQCTQYTQQCTRRLTPPRVSSLVLKKSLVYDCFMRV